MDMTTIVSDLRDAIADSTVIKSWSQATYNRDHTVYVGVDARNPPADDEFPLVAISPGLKSASDSSETREHHISVSLGVYDETKATSTRTNVVEYNGVQRRDALRKLVEMVVVSVIEGNLGMIIAGFDAAYDSLDVYPYFLCDMKIQADEYRSQGDAVFD